GAAIVILMIIGLPIGFCIIAIPKFGVVSLLVASYFLFAIMRMNLTTFPLGTVMDALLLLLLAGMFMQQKYKPDWSFINSPISLMVLLWIVYNFIMVANPVAESKMAWLYTIRSMA